MNLYSAYDYLAFVLPGGIIVFAASAGHGGLPTADIGVGLLVVLLGGAFLIGHMLAAIAAFLEPLAWGHTPTEPVDPTWGLTGRAGYSDAEVEEIKRELAVRFRREGSFKRLYQLAYTDLQSRGKDARLNIFNSQISFYRNGSVAFIGAAGIQVAYQLLDTAALDSTIWLPLYLVGATTFLFRYKRFWRQFADNVIRGSRIDREAPLGKS